MEVDTFLKEGKEIEAYLEDQRKVCRRQLEKWPLQVIDNDSRSYPGFLHNRWTRCYNALTSHVKKTDKILELGCRTALFCHFMRQRGFENMYGIETCEEAVKIATEHNGCKSGRCMVGDAHKMPWPDKYFDAIVATEIIEHSYDPPLLFKELARVLKDDGVIFTTIPNEGQPKKEGQSQHVGHVIFFPHPTVFMQYAIEHGFLAALPMMIYTVGGQKFIWPDLNLYPPNEEGKCWLQGCGFIMKKIKEEK